MSGTVHPLNLEGYGPEPVRAAGDDNYITLFCARLWAMKNYLGQVSIDLPRGVLSVLKQDPTDFVQEMRLADAVNWHERV